MLLTCIWQEDWFVAAYDDDPCCPLLLPFTVQVVAQAGLPAAVTIATNMAGRGTDIILGGNPEGLTRMSIKRYILRWGAAAWSWAKCSVHEGAFEWMWQMFSTSVCCINFGK